MFNCAAAGTQQRPFTPKPCSFPTLVAQLRVQLVCVCVCWQTVRKEVIGFQGRRQLTKNTLPRWRPLTKGGDLRKESSWRISRGIAWLAGPASFNRLRPMSLSLTTLLHSCSAAQRCVPSVFLFNFTSKRLIMELIRANPLWGNTELDVSWLRRDVFILLEDEVWRRAEASGCFKQSACRKRQTQGGASILQIFFKLSETDNPTSSPTCVEVKKYAGSELLSRNCFHHVYKRVQHHERFWGTTKNTALLVQVLSRDISYLLSNHN